MLFGLQVAHVDRDREIRSMNTYGMSALASALVVLCAPALAHAQDAEPPSRAPAAPPPAAPPPAETAPKLGGHLGLALPVLTLSQETTTIGGDFVSIGITPGITYHLDDKWSIDLEFIAFNEVKRAHSATTFVVDPGVLRKFDGFVLGGRVATQVGAPTNIGLVPIVVVPFKVSDQFSYFVEADVPLFARDNGRAAVFSATLQFQTGFAF